MHEILKVLGAGERVLDIGSGPGSFASANTRASVFRADLKRPKGPVDGFFVQCDAAHLPFTAAAFDALISNHSLEHFPQLESSLSEMGRVLKPAGALYIAAPDASTLSDKLYRWVSHGGGHVNAFTHARAVAALIERVTGVPHRATRLLHTSLAFLNLHNLEPPLPRRWRALAYEPGLRIATFVMRTLDRWFGTRTSIYGWAFYFGSVEDVDTTARTNVCVRCGSGHSAQWLQYENRLVVRWGLARYECPVCGALNYFTRDAS